MDAIYLTESMLIYWLQMLYEYWDEVDTPYFFGFDLWPKWLFQYFKKLSLVESVESAYLIWKS